MQAAPNEEKVTLITMEVFTPYKANEVFAVSREVADKLLRRDMTVGDFGPVYPKVKVRLFDPKSDWQHIVNNGSMNEAELEQFLIDNGIKQPPREAEVKFAPEEDAYDPDEQPTTEAEAAGRRPRRK